MHYVFSALIGYLFGCSSMSYYISKIKKVDIKGRGSKNYGASNTLALAGKKAGALVFIHDFLKAVIAVIVANMLFPNTPYVGALAGCCAVVGHIFPFYLHFDGGKGYAAFIGMSIAMYPLFGFGALIVSLLLAILTDYIVASTFSMTLFIPIYALLIGDSIDAVIIFATTILIFIKHKENIKNLITRNGKEMTIKSTVFKKKNTDGGKEYDV